jgi:hypothetical protein
MGLEGLAWLSGRASHSAPHPEMRHRMAQPSQSSVGKPSIFFVLSEFKSRLRSCIQIFSQRVIMSLKTLFEMMETLKLANLQH